MSFMDDIKDAVSNPLFDAVEESYIDDELDSDFAIEAATNKIVELSENDIAAILDDNNSDNIACDLERDEEMVDNIAEDDFDNVIESLLVSLESDDSMIPDPDDPRDDPEANEEDLSVGDQSEDTDDDDYLSLDSLLDSMF